MYTNLLGDYIKGSDYSKYSEKTQEGIKLHRTIDNYIDTHPIVKNLLHELYEPLPKISGIAVDLYFDHLLARNWNQYHDASLFDFVQKFYAIKPEHSEDHTAHFNFMIDKMKEMDWLYAYRKHEGLVYACTGLSKRISFENALAKAPEIFLEKEASIELAFKQFMQEAIPHFKDYFKNN